MFSKYLLRETHATHREGWGSIPCPRATCAGHWHWDMVPSLVLPVMHTQRPKSHRNTTDFIIAITIIIIIIIIITTATIIIVDSTALGGPWPPQANVASDLYPGQPSTSFLSPASLCLCLPPPCQSILI